MKSKSKRGDHTEMHVSQVSSLETTAVYRVLSQPFHYSVPEGFYCPILPLLAMISTWLYKGPCRLSYQ